MKICFPVTRHDGLESIVYGHFGSAPMFLVVDSESGEILSQDNGDRSHGHGQCRPLKALAGVEVDAIVVGGIGKGALKGLNAAGLKVYQAIDDTVTCNLAAIQKGELKELAGDMACAGHGHSHGHGNGHKHGSHHEFGCGF